MDRWALPTAGRSPRCDHQLMRVPKGPRTRTAALLAWALAASAGAKAGVADHTPPLLERLTFSTRAVEDPEQTVAIEFDATDDDSGVAYFEISLTDSTGAFHRSASAAPAPARKAHGRVELRFPA